VGEVGEVDLVEDLAVGGRIGLRRARPIASLVGVGEPTEGARSAPGVDRGVDDAVAEVEVALGMRVEVGEERAEEAEDERDQRQRGQRDEVGTTQAEPVQKERPRRL